MRYKTRLGILFGFIALFLVTAPLVVLYTAGYRWNGKKLKPEKVGIIFLRSRPSGADIYLDGEKRRETTPARLRDLLPDDYEVKVSKEGYAAWSKRLPVDSAKTTFAEGIILWKLAEPEKVGLTPDEALTAEELASLRRTEPLEATASGTEFGSDGFEIWTKGRDGSKETVTRLSDPIASIIPYTDSGWIIYETATQIRAIERDGRDRRNDFELASGAALHGLAVSPDGRTLYWLSGSGADEALWKRQLQ